VVATVQQHHLWTAIPPAERPLASQGIFTNNIVVAVLAYAGAILFTAPTIVILVMNGFSLGAVGGF
jgi:uncharacterized membrane protein SpoIIM required for sporulation